MAREDVEHTSGPPDSFLADRTAERLFHAVAVELVATSRTPITTYRLQFGAGFGFDAARAILPYLARLGVTDLYASPYLKATPGSTHGYDCVDHQTLNPEVGDEAQHTAFCAALHERGLGQLLDFVPNHMGIERGNAMWSDVLENGPASLYANVFDIDWQPIKDELEGKVLLPILGDQYGEVLERGELKLRFASGAFWVDYFDHALPVSVRQYAAVLKHGWDALERDLRADDAALIELQSILTAIEHLPRRTDREAPKRAERNREKEVIKRRLSQLVTQSAAVRAHLDRSVAWFNGRAGEARSFDALDQLLQQCSFRIAHWRVAGEEINYRRFFDINTLAAIRTEDPEVFAEAHARIFRWLDEGKLTGLRIDHPDGLFDPTQYFLRLQEEFFVRRARRHPEGAALSPESWSHVEPELRARFRSAWAESPDAREVRSLYVVVEKIQGGRERIPEAWAVHGTTGYRFANITTGLFVDPSAERMLTRTWERFIGQPMSYRDLLYEKKQLVVAALMGSEMNVLARELNRISEMNRHTRDFTLGTLKRALVGFVALFPVYRTYVDDWRLEVDERDIRYIQWTIRRAKEKDPTTNASTYDFLERILLRRYAGHVTPEQREVMLRFAMKLQQLTGPVMAKGLEDTLFYIYNRFIALNEVGGEPDRFGASVAAFHLRNQERAEKWPAALLTTSTHDTKRSEDVRARLCVLSEMPAKWTEAVRRWARLNKRFKTAVGQALAPSANDEYLYYQTLLGAWPMGGDLDEEALGELRQRLREYMLKAVREAKVQTSWLNPDASYEAATVRFVDQTLATVRSRFVQDALGFKRMLERPGQVNALSQLLLKLASPGTTDVYQGTELWDLSLVDPDNRRPVDFARRQELLEALDRRVDEGRETLCRELFADMSDGRAKLFVLSQGLRFRRLREALFRQGSYVPLDVTGTHADCAVAFARRYQAQWALAVAPRLVAHMLEDWPHALVGTEVRVPDELEGVELVDVFSGRPVKPERRNGAVCLELPDLWRLCPVALLEKKWA